MPESFERGAVVRCKDRLWIVWSSPAPGAVADAIALPLRPQTGPLHRSQTRLDFAGRRVLVHLLDPVSLRRGDCAFVGQCSADIVARLAALMRRAIAAELADVAPLRRVA